MSGHTPYVKGKVIRTWLDLGKLGLEPLGLEAFGPWNPEDAGRLFEEDPNPLYDEIRAAGPRHEYKMEVVLPEDVLELWREEDPILEAVELAAPGCRWEAEGLLGHLLQADLRCLDSYAYLGNLQFERDWLDLVERHDRVGVTIGELSLPELGDLLPRGLLDNQPFLHCLHLRSTPAGKHPS